MDELLLSIDEAARRLSCGRSYLYELIRRGEIVSVKLGRSRRVPVQALQDYAQARIAEEGENEVARQ